MAAKGLSDGGTLSKIAPMHLKCEERVSPALPPAQRVFCGRPVLKLSPHDNIDSCF